MEFAAMVRSVLKLSAGIQLALRSSLGCVRLPLPAGTGTHRHVHSWQASPKTCEKPGDSWMLLSQAAFKRKKIEKRKKASFMCSKSRTFGATQKSLFNTLPKTLFMSSMCDASHICTTSKQQEKKGKKVLLHIISYVLILSMFDYVLYLKSKN